VDAIVDFLWINCRFSTEKNRSKILHRTSTSFQEKPRKNKSGNIKEKC